MHTQLYPCAVRMGADCGNNLYIDFDVLVGADARPQALIAIGSLAVMRIWAS